MFMFTKAGRTNYEINERRVIMSNHKVGRTSKNPNFKKS